MERFHSSAPRDRERERERERKRSICGIVDACEHESDLPLVCEITVEVTLTDVSRKRENGLDHEGEHGERRDASRLTQVGCVCLRTEG